MPAKPLTQEQEEDAKRLKAAFKRYQDRLTQAGEPASQDVIAERLPFGQSAMNQYLNGRIPLNGEALLAFCSLMGEDPRDISPSIHAREFDWSLKWVNPGAGRHTSQDQGEVQMPIKGLPKDVIEALGKADQDSLGAITITLRMMLGLDKSPSGKRHQA